MEQLCRVGLSLSDVMGIFSSNETSEENDFKYHISLNVSLRKVSLFYSFTKIDILGLLTDFQMENSDKDKIWICDDLISLI